MSKLLVPVLAWLVVAAGCGSPPSSSPVTPAPSTVQSDPFVYCRATDYLAIHIDAKALSATAFFSDPKPILPTRGLPEALIRNLKHWLGSVRQTESMTIFIGPGIGDSPYYSRTFFEVYASQKDRDAMAQRFKDSGIGTDEAVHAGQKYWRVRFADSQVPSGLLEVDDRRLLVCTEPGLQEILASKGAVQNAALAQLMQPAMKHGQLAVAIDVTKGRRVEHSEVLLRRMIDPSQELEEALGWTERGTLTLDFIGPILLETRLDAHSEESAKKLLEAASRKRSMPKRSLPTPGNRHLPQLDPHLRKMFSIGEALMAGVKATRSGKVVSVTVASPSDWKDLPDTIRSIHRVETANFQRQMAPSELGLLFLSLQDRADSLTLRTETGEALLSWRVGLLSHIDEAAFKEFNDKEPWDSAKNLKAAQKIFEIYQPLFPSPPGTSAWRLIPGRPGGIVLVEGGEGSAVPWTKPEEVRIDPNNPLVSLGNEPEEGYRVVYRDGQSERLSAAQLRKQLLAPPTKAGEE